MEATLRTATAIYSVSAALLCMGVGTLVLVWGLRVSISEALSPSETTISGGSVPITIREVPMPVLHFSKTLEDGTIVTFDCPRNENETAKQHATRAKAEWADILGVLEG